MISSRNNLKVGLLAFLLIIGLSCCVSPLGRAEEDEVGAEGLSIPRGVQNHYFRKNDHGNTLVIITGLVKNNYPDKRNFIRLRGYLLDAHNRCLAERYIYAGNILSEEDLVNLPVDVIMDRLHVSSGQNRRNMNIEPGGELPFMVVFDELPVKTTEYRIDPVSSSPSK